MIRLGLCCVFRDEPIKFRSTTATHLAKLDRADALLKVSGLCHGNALSLFEALRFCRKSGIGCFRINSGILPCKTHPEVGYDIKELPDHRDIVAEFMRCGAYAVKHDIRLCFHPDQFVVLNSPRQEVVKASIRDLDHHAEVAGWVGADVVNIHAGGVYGDKAAALSEFVRNFYKVGMDARRLMTVENDDDSYTPEDLLPICSSLGIPLVYDVHHHRVNGDRLSIEEATTHAVDTWSGREPMFHISSPRNGWGEVNESQHHDFVSLGDFPDCWRGLDITVEVEAKAKEAAVSRLAEGLGCASQGRGEK